MNPRSVYNKLNEFHEFVKEEEVDLLFMSESWKGEKRTSDKIIKIEDFEIKCLTKKCLTKKRSWGQTSNSC